MIKLYMTLLFLISSLHIIAQHTISVEDVNFYNNTITNCKSSFSHTEIIIPNTLNDEIVSEIGDYTFENRQLTSVTLPETLTRINFYAFYINKISDLVIPSSVVTIGEEAFGSNEITSLTLNEGVTYIEFGAFSRNYLTDVNLPNSVKNIGHYAFFGNVDYDNPMIELTTITLPTERDGYYVEWKDENNNTVTQITDFTLSYNSTLTSNMVEYDISYHLNGGTSEDNAVNYNVESPDITLNDASKPGYTFLGWYNNETFSGSQINKIQQGSFGNKNLWARFEIANSVKDSPNADFIVYPNPAIDKISIRSEAQIKAIEVYSTDGLLVLKSKPSKASNNIDIAQLKAGTYIIRTQTTNSVRQQTFIKL